MFWILKNGQVPICFSEQTRKHRIRCHWVTADLGYLSFYLSLLPALHKRKEEKWLLWRLITSHPSGGGTWLIQTSQGTSENSGKFSRGPGSWTSFLERESKQPCAGHQATGIVLGALSHLSLVQFRGESITLLILLEGNLKITQLLRAKLEFGTSSPQPQSTSCSMKKKNDLRSDLSSHTYIFYIGCGLEMHTSIILAC